MSQRKKTVAISSTEKKALAWKQCPIKSEFIEE